MMVYVHQFEGDICDQRTPPLARLKRNCRGCVVPFTCSERPRAVGIELARILQPS